MPFTPGTRLGAYEVLALLGSGGMGEVYRARDTRLERVVAIKTLREDLAGDPNRRARFEREARVVSQLNHPDICTLFDIGREGAIDYLVMEFIDGQTLAARLQRGALSIDQALQYAIAIGAALDAAHRAGVIHRDVKPANVMLTATGVKLLDFGIARTLAPASTSSDGAGPLESGATAAQALTEAGTFLGSGRYMAPEQLEGHDASTRSDVFAFGAVLFEMLTGRPAFAGETRASVIAAVLERDPPPVSSLRHRAPPALDRVVRKCLAKDPDARWQTVRDLVDELKWIAEGVDGLPVAVAPSRRWRAIAAAIAVVAVAAATVAATVFLRGSARDREPEGAQVRFWISPPNGAGFARGADTTFLALSPDGTELATVVADAAAGSGTESGRIWLRPTSALDARPVTGTDGARSVFWSPDGRSLAFFTEDKLKQIDLASETVLTVCDATGRRSTGTWGSDGRILFTSGTGETILSVPAAGGIPMVAVRRDESRGQSSIQWPSFLSDGQRFVYVVRLRDGSRQLMLTEADHPARPVLSLASNAEWVGAGYFVFARREGTLMAQRFDLDAGRIVGDPFLIAQSVDYAFGSGRAMFTASRNADVVAYQPQQLQRMIWLDRAGKEIAAVAQPAQDYGRLRLSPDGHDLLFSRMQVGSGSHDLWKLDLRRDVEDRLTADPGSDLGSVWLSGGRAVAFSADRASPPPHVFRKDLTTGEEEQWLPAGKFQLVDDVSPDGATLIFSELASRNHWELWFLRTGASHERSPVRRSPSTGIDARYSPDGRFVSFTSGDSGASEVYVVPVSKGATVRVSAMGGTTARWSRDGRELFYLAADGELIALPVRTRPSLVFGTPVPLFMASSIKQRRDQEEFDVAPDGQRFVAVVPSPQPAVAVVLHAVANVSRR